MPSPVTISVISVLIEGIESVSLPQVHALSDDHGRRVLRQITEDNTNDRADMSGASG